MISAVVISAMIVPHITQVALKGLMFRTLWFWISTMQLQNALSLCSVNMPENVLTVQTQFNDIINLQFIPKELIEEFFARFKSSDEEESEEASKK